MNGGRGGGKEEIWVSSTSSSVDIRVRRRLSDFITRATSFNIHLAKKLPSWIRMSPFDMKGISSLAEGALRVKMFLGAG